MYPIVNGLEETYSEINFERLDAAVQENAQLQLQYGVRGHPTFVLLDEDEVVVQTWIGPQSEQALREAITAVLEDSG